MRGSEPLVRRNGEFAFMMWSFGGIVFQRGAAAMRILGGVRRGVFVGNNSAFTFALE
jgi:hypothetical protein